MLGAFSPGDMVLRDRAFAGYGIAADLLARGVHSVSRIHQCLSVSITEIKRIGPGDRIVRWSKPKKPNAGFTAQQWAALPPHIDVRLVDVHVGESGFRTQRYTLLTTLLDAKKYPAAALAQLYKRRWEVELFFREIKQTMGFAELRSRTPDMIRRELAMALLAYNLLRGLMAEAAAKAGLDPARISLAAAAQVLRQSAPWRRNRRRSTEQLLSLLAACETPDRPGRHSPRAVKRRHNKYPLLNTTRNQFREIKHRARYSTKTK